MTGWPDGTSQKAKTERFRDRLFRNHGFVVSALVPVFSSGWLQTVPSLLLRQIDLDPDFPTGSQLAMQQALSKNCASLEFQRMKNVLNIDFRPLRAAALFSMFVNILMLTGPLFMLQVYDRVLTSQSVPTLLALGIIVLVLFVFLGFLDFVRMRVMTGIGQRIDQNLAENAFEQNAVGHLRNSRTLHSNPLKDLRTVRLFLSSPAAVTLFDLPWLPLYMAIIFLLHPLLGYAGVAGALLLIVLAVLNERLSHKLLQDGGRLDIEEANVTQASRRNAENLIALGMVAPVRERWLGKHREAVTTSSNASYFSSLFGAVSKTTRMAIQSIILGLGAYLAILQEITPGTMIAVSIIFSRALAPAEQTIAHWRAISEARLSWQRIKSAFGQQAEEEVEHGTLPAPTQLLTVENMAIAPPLSRNISLRNVSFPARGGEAIGVLGPSGSGKSTLAKALTGAWQYQSGSIRLDEAELSQWPGDILGQHIGYLSQEIELIEGTIAENIARFRSNTKFESILEAGELSGAHQMILRLPDGYDTRIGGNGGIQLSAGQRQQVALARAVFGNPFLIVLDEPNSNLDTNGDIALARAISRLKQNGSIVIVVTHRTSILAELDKLLILKDGQPQLFGPRDKVIAHLQKNGTGDNILPGGDNV